MKPAPEPSPLGHVHPRYPQILSSFTGLRATEISKDTHGFNCQFKVFSALPLNYNQIMYIYIGIIYQ